MIRSRLRTTVLMVLAVVIGLGLGAMWLVHSHTRRFERLLDEELQAIMTTHVITFHAQIISSYALEAAANTASGTVKSRDPVVTQACAALKAAGEKLRAKAQSPHEEQAVAELTSLIDSLLTEMQPATDPIGDRTNVPGAHSGRVAELSRGIARVSQRVAALNDSRLVAERAGFANQTRDATLYVALLTAVALLILFVLYWQFNTLALRPLATLTESVREVENRNFELSLPVRRDDEIGRLSHAYNDMAAELRRLYHETDRHIVDLNARNRALLTAFPHAVIVLDDDGKLLQINPEAESILSSLGTPNRLPAKLKKPFDHCRSSGDEFLPDELDQALLFRIGEREVYYLPRIFRLPAVEDMDPAWGIILTDVSRFRWLDDMKMNVLATVSHEIKTPLTSIRMILLLLLEQKTGKLTGLQEEMVGSASNDCERLLETLGTLLQHSRLSSGSKHLDLKALAPSSLFENIPLSLQQAAADKKVTLSVLSNGTLPLVSADEPRIAQVITNLLSNAIKFTPPSSTVTLNAVKLGPDFVRFKISDQGPGVPSDAQDRIFERFYREPGQKHAGTGLGLSISREIIEAHNGRIGFKSKPNESTTFYFDLPIA
jgi:two-component system, NtrC family, sensor histidine kinase KinB